MGKKIKSILLFNLDEIIQIEVGNLISFTTKYSITNRTDTQNLLIYYVLKRILEIYRDNRGMIVFYLSKSCYNWLDTNGAITRKLNFKKLINVFTKKIPFNIIISSLTFDKFESLMESNSPEYSEIVNDYRFISSYMTSIMRVIRSLRFHSLEESITQNLMEQIKIISTFEKVPDCNLKVERN